MGRALYVGIDPGLSGAIAVLDADGDVVALDDAPVVVVHSGKRKRREHLVPACAGLLREWARATRMAWIEKVGAMPGQGVTSMFRFGASYGMCLGILGALRFSYERVTPQRWTRDMLAGLPRGKGSGLIRARELWPSAPLERVKDSGRADALLIAEACRRANLGLDGGLAGTRKSHVGGAVLKKCGANSEGAGVPTDR